LSDAFDALLTEYPDFEEIVRRFASPPICNSGTLCGNVANGSPVGDSMPGLIALGAEVCLRRKNDTRCVALEDFYLDYMKKDLQPGEFVRSVRVPRAKAGVVFRSYKISKRFDQDISAVCAAFALELNNGTIASARVCFGGMAATPKRAVACERALTGARWDSEAVENAVTAILADFEPITDMRASGEYRKQIAGNLLRRFFAETADLHAKRGKKTAVSVWDYAGQRT
jgi:xanthine dehydrogenase small subunit